MQARPPHHTRRVLRRNLLRPTQRSHDDLEALRQLVVGPEQARLDVVEHPSPDVIGKVLPESLSHAALIRPQELTGTLEKPVTSAIREIAAKHPTVFGEILAPAIGTAVRRAVADALAAIMQRINQIVERGLSIQSLRWRLEAWHTGRPFGEIVVARTLVYRVEWAVLIDSRTSLVLHQASSTDVVQHAPDQTAAMLAAINSFVSDAMQPASPGAAVHAIEVGDLSLWIERDPLFTLAIAIRGAAPRTLRDDLRGALVRAQAVPRSPGSPATTEEMHPLLTELLKQQLRTPPMRAKWILAVLGGGALLLAAFLILRNHSGANADAQLRAAYRDRLSAVPGIVVTSVERSGDDYVVRGLRDPRSAPPALILAATGLSPPRLELFPYDSRDPRFAGPMTAVDRTMDELEHLEIEFERGESNTGPSASSLRRAAELVNRLQRAAVAADASVCVEVLGDSDNTGPEYFNVELRAARAAQVVAALKASGVPDKVLVPRAGAPLRARPGARRVTFRATLHPTLKHGDCT
jgi:hypothetical protein